MNLGEKIQFLLKRHNGFTLAEMMTVLLIIGILSAIAAPNLLSWYRQQQLYLAVTNIKGGLQQAQREAIRRSIDCTITVDATRNKLIDGGNGCLMSERTVPEFIDLTLTNNRSSHDIEFNFRGNINPSSQTTFRFSNEAVKNTECLVISAPLGMIRTGRINANNRCHRS